MVDCDRYGCYLIRVTSGDWRRLLIAWSLHFGNALELGREKCHQGRSVDLLVGENVVLEVTRHCDAFVVDQVRPNVILGELQT